MRLKHLLLTTAATAVLAVSGFAQAQQSTPPSGGANKSAPPAASQSAPPSGSQSMPSAGGASSGSMSSGAAASTAGLHEIDDDKAQVQSLNVSAKDLADMDIHASDGKKIGEVNKLLGDSSNQVKAVTIDVGGFLGIGGREVVIPIDKLQKGQDAKKLQTSMTKAEIEQLAEWKDSDDDRARRDATPGRAPASTPPASNPPATTR
jgi:sporulation protein YlmC with PRC-barrel domain